MGAPDPVFESAEALYEGAPCGYISSRPDGTVVRVNRTFLIWTGQQHEDVVGRRFQDMLSVGSRVYYETHVAPMLAMHGSVKEIQLELACAEDRTLPVLLSTTRATDSSGQSVVLRSTVFDISDRKRYERELLLARKAAEQRARLATLGAEMGAALTEAILLPQQLQRCADALVEHVDAIEARIWLATLPSGELALTAVSGAAPGGISARPARAPERESRAASERRVTVTRRGDPDAPGLDEEWLRRESVETCVALPLVAADHVLGVLVVYLREPLAPEVERALVTASGELALALDRAQANQERVRLFEALRQSRELLDTTLRSIGDGVISTDSRACVTFLNPVAERLTGWSLAEAQGRPLAEVLRIVNEVTRAEVESPVDKVLRLGVVVGLANHTVLVRRDGSEIDIDDSAAPIRSAEGNVIGVVMVFRDVSAQRAAERELRETQQRLSTVVRNVPVILVFLDPDGRVLVSEGKGFAALGIHEPASRVGELALEVFAHVPWLLGELRRAVAGEAFVGGGALGQLVYETHYAPTYETDGRLAGTVCLALDVTERKRYDEAVNKTIEFEQQLVGIVSHDLRNPVSAILLGASVMLRRGDGLRPEDLRTVARIQTSAQRAQRLIRDLLDFTQARLGAGIPIERAETDLTLVVQQVLEEVAAGGADRAVELVGQGNFRGQWDADRLAQVVTNLVVNALKYSPPDSPVRVLLEDHGSSVSLTVQNEGDPIPRAAREALFLPMQRATPVVDRSARSVGLGLYIVKQLVDAHGGTVEVQSEPGTGTLFRVLLPRTAGLSPAPSPGR